MNNPYLWVFAMSALASVPVRAEVRVRFDGKLRFEVLLHVLGASLAFRNRDRSQKKQGMSPWSGLLGKLHEIRQILKSLHFYFTKVHVHISCEDAAAAAIGYSFVCCLLCTAQACLPFAFEATADMDFRAEGSFASFVCITDTRLGNLGAAILRLWLLTHAQPKTEEEKYAASH